MARVRAGARNRVRVKCIYSNRGVHRVGVRLRVRAMVHASTIERPLKFAMVWCWVQSSIIYRFMSCLTLVPSRSSVCSVSSPSSGFRSKLVQFSCLDR